MDTQHVRQLNSRLEGYCTVYLQLCNKSSHIWPHKKTNTYYFTSFWGSGISEWLNIRGLAPAAVISRFHWGWKACFQVHVYGLWQVSVPGWLLAGCFSFLPFGLFHWTARNKAASFLHKEGPRRNTNSVGTWGEFKHFEADEGNKQDWKMAIFHKLHKVAFGQGCMKEKFPHSRRPPRGSMRKRALPPKGKRARGPWRSREGACMSRWYHSARVWISGLWALKCHSSLQPFMVPFAVLSYLWLSGVEFGFMGCAKQAGSK